jgi:hypothetical protein
MGMDIWLPIELAKNLKENFEVHARAQAAAREKSIALEAEVDKLKEQIAQEAAEREREKEENRRRMQEELENAKINLREEMKQEFLNMLAQHKEGAMIMVLEYFFIICTVDNLIYDSDA